MFSISQNFPNPFNSGTEIRFNMVTGAPVRLAIVDLLGRELAVLVDDAWYAGGAYAVNWDGMDAFGREVASGTYFAELTSDGRRVVLPMVKVK
jgi:hypothetical protein